MPSSPTQAHSCNAHGIWGISRHLGLGFLLSVKSFNKTFTGGSPAFSSASLINPFASSTPIPTAGRPPRCLQILPLPWILCLCLKEEQV